MPRISTVPIAAPPPARRMRNTDNGALSTCARLYLAASTDPHSILDRHPCIPDSLAAPSFKFAVRSRFEFAVGTAGVAGVAVWPFRMLANNRLENTGPDPDVYFSKIMVTNAGFTGTNLGLLTSSASYTFPIPPPGVTPVDSTTSIFSQADFSAPFTRSARLVGSGIRVGYTGSVTDQRGTILFARNPQATSTLTTSFDDLNELLQYQGVTRIMVRDMTSDGSNGVTYKAVSNVDFNPITSPLGVVALTSPPEATNNRLGYVVLVTGATPGAIFTGDVVTFFEAYGAQLPLTPSEADVSGHAAAMAAVSSAPPNAIPQSLHAQALASAVRGLASVSGRGLRAGVSEVITKQVPIVAYRAARAAAPYLARQAFPGLLRYAA